MYQDNLEKNKLVNIDEAHQQGLLKLNPQLVHGYYFEYWDKLTSNIIARLDTYGTGYEKMSLNEFIQLSCRHTRKEGFKSLLKTELENFNYVLNHHDLDEKSITLLIQNFNSLFSLNKEGIIEKILCVYEKINTEFPQLEEYFTQCVDTMRSEISKNALKSILEKNRLDQQVETSLTSLKKIKI